MKPHDQFEPFDTLSIVERRAAILLGLRWRDRGRLDRAFADTSLIRKRLARKLKGFNGTAAIRRWRDSR